MAELEHFEKTQPTRTLTRPVRANTTTTTTSRERCKPCNDCYNSNNVIRSLASLEITTTTTTMPKRRHREHCKPCDNIGAEEDDGAGSNCMDVDGAVMEDGYVICLRQVKVVASLAW